MVKVADTPGPAYQEGAFAYNPTPQIPGDLPYFRYPGLYLLYGYATTPAQALSYGFAMGSQVNPAGSSWLKRQTIWTAGFIAGFSLAGFGASATAAVYSAYTATAAIATAGAFTIGTAALTGVVESSLPSSVAGAFSSGVFIGSVSNLTLQLAGGVAQEASRGSYQGVGIGESASGLSGTVTARDILESTNPGLKLILDLLGL